MRSNDPLLPRLSPIAHVVPHKPPPYPTSTGSVLTSSVRNHSATVRSPEGSPVAGALMYAVPSNDQLAFGLSKRSAAGAPPTIVPLRPNPLVSSAVPSSG